MDIKEQAIAISNFKEQSINELQAEVSNNEIELTLQEKKKKFINDNDREVDLDKQQEEFLLEESRERHYEKREFI